MGIVFSQAPLTTTCINVANLSLCGAPFLSGFYSKDLILEISLFNPTRSIIVLLIFIATGITAAYSLRLSFCSLWGAPKGNPFHAKAERDLYINFSTITLSLAAVVAGFFLQSIFLDFNPTPFVLPSLYKGLTIFVILSGFFISRILWDPHFSSKALSKKGFFFTTMWFLALISAQPLSKRSLKLGTNLMKSVDQGWLEILGGQGTFTVARRGSTLNAKVQLKAFNFFILTMLYFLLVCLVYFS